jgi:hypothetical protein
MKTVLRSMVVFAALTLGVAGQSAQPQPQGSEQAPSPAKPQANLNATLAEIQRITVATNADIGRLRIERWKTDAAQKQQFQQMADSLQRNITSAVPGLISNVQSAPGSVTRMFKLYNDLTVVYEYLGSLSEAAGELGKREEYEPLASDTTALATARHSMADLIEQAGLALETPPKPPPQPEPAQVVKKIVVDNDLSAKPAPKKTQKAAKKTSPAASATSAPPK